MEAKPEVRRRRAVATSRKLAKQVTGDGSPFAIANAVPVAGDDGRRMYEPVAYAMSQHEVDLFVRQADQLAERREQSAEPGDAG